MIRVFRELKRITPNNKTYKIALSPDTIHAVVKNIILGRHQTESPQ